MININGSYVTDKVQLEKRFRKMKGVRLVIAIKGVTIIDVFHRWTSGAVQKTQDGDDEQETLKKKERHVEKK